SKNKVLRALGTAYITVFRSVPVLVQLLIWGNVGLIIRNVSLGIPFTDVRFFSMPTNELIGPFTAAVLGLALAEAAYIAEVVRGGVSAVDKGQAEAASALGMTPARVTRRVILPQALRPIIPPLATQSLVLTRAASLGQGKAGEALRMQATKVHAAV